jgi:hypothetical protein
MLSIRVLNYRLRMIRAIQRIEEGVVQTVHWSAPE